MSQITSKEKAPEILYKYKPMNQSAKDIIRNGRIYFANPCKLNDPFEYMITFERGDWYTLSENERKLYGVSEEKSENGPYFLTPEQRTKRYFYAMKNDSNGAFCLSAAKDNIYMYCHYADSFKGICIGFNSQIFENHRSLRKMDYAEEPYVSPETGQNDWAKMLSTKSLIFKEEQEWRIVDNAGKLLDGCDLFIISEHPELSKLPINFRYGFIYNTQAEPEQTGFFFFDEKRQNQLISLNPIPTSVNPNDLNALIEMIHKKTIAPEIAHFSNKELLLLRENFSLTNTGELFPNKPITLEPAEIKNNIVEIIFGFNISEKDVKYIMKNLKRVKPKYYVARPIIGQYKVDIIPFTDYEKDIRQYQIIYGYTKTT